MTRSTTRVPKTMHTKRGATIEVSEDSDPTNVSPITLSFQNQSIGSPRFNVNLSSEEALSLFNMLGERIFHVNPDEEIAVGIRSRGTAKERRMTVRELETLKELVKEAVDETLDDRAKEQNHRAMMAFNHQHTFVQGPPQQWVRNP